MEAQRLFVSVALVLFFTPFLTGQYNYAGIQDTPAIDIKSYTNILRDLRDNWQSPIFYLKKRGYIPADNVTYDDKMFYEKQADDKQQNEKNFEYRFRTGNVTENSDSRYNVGNPRKEDRFKPKSPVGEDYFGKTIQVRNEMMGSLASSHIPNSMPAKPSPSVLGQGQVVAPAQATQQPLQAAATPLKNPGFLKNVKDKFYGLFSNRKPETNPKTGFTYDDSLEFDQDLPKSFNTDSKDYFKDAEHDLDFEKMVVKNTGKDPEVHRDVVRRARQYLRRRNKFRRGVQRGGAFDYS